MLKFKPAVWACATICFSVLSPLSVQAQPEANTVPKGNPPGWRDGGGPEQTPEQRAATQKERRQKVLTYFMNAGGITDTATQTTILDYSEEQEAQRAKLRSDYETLGRGLAAATFGGPALTDAQIADQLLTLREEVEEEKTRRTAASAALDAKIHFHQNPRLDAFLTMTGLVGDDAFYINGMGGVNGSGGRPPRMGAPRGGQGPAPNGVAKGTVNPAPNAAAPANPGAPPQPPQPRPE